MVESDPDDLIVSCYLLADRYHQNPDMFLSMPVSDIDRHIHFTNKAHEIRRKARERGAIDDDD